MLSRKKHVFLFECYKKIKINYTYACGNNNIIRYRLDYRMRLIISTGLGAPVTVRVLTVSTWWQRQRRDRREALRRRRRRRPGHDYRRPRENFFSFSNCGWASYRTIIPIKSERPPSFEDFSTGRLYAKDFFFFFQYS